MLCIFFSQEKWDSMTRKWKDNCLLQLVRLFLIDEVSVLIRYLKNVLRRYNTSCSVLMY